MDYKQELIRLSVYDVLGKMTAGFYVFPRIMNFITSCSYTPKMPQMIATFYRQGLELQYRDKHTLNMEETYMGDFTLLWFLNLHHDFECSSIVITATKFICFGGLKSVILSVITGWI